MEQSFRGSLQRISAGFMIVAFAVAILVAWAIGEWWMFFPVVMIEAGVFYAALGLASGKRESQAHRGPSDSSYYIFWGPTLVILGAMWVISAKTDVNAIVLLVVFLLWVGAIAMALSLRKKGSSPSA